jgi:eukaryotic-like serine/threonine-protein kinase
MATLAPIAGRYELRALLLDDGLKQSWVAFDRQLDRDVSVELATTADPELQQRFLVRARLLAGENHPHLVTVYDTGEHDDQAYAVLEPETDGTLAHRLQTGPPFGLTQVVELGIALSVAAAAALHRDLDVEPLDPRDVLLRDGDHVKLANLLLRPVDVPPPAVASEQPLVAQIAALLVAAMQPAGAVVTPVTRAADLPSSLPVTLRTIVLAAIAPRGASIRTLAELRQALTEYRGAALSTTRAFAPLTGASAADLAAPAVLGGAGVPVTRAMPGAGRRAGGGGGAGRSRRRTSPWLSIIGLLVVLLLIGGAVAFAEWIGSVDTAPPSVPAITDAAQATPAARGVGLPPIFTRASPTPTSVAGATATPTPAPVTQGQLGGSSPETPTPTVGGARATETALAMASATAGYFATQTATAGPSPTPPALPTPLPSPTLPPAPPTYTPLPAPTPAPPTATPIPSAAVPNVNGRPVDEASQTLAQAGFNVARRPNRTSATVPAGAVIAQEPAAAAVAPVGSTVLLTVSSGPPAPMVPNVVGATAEQAQASIAGVGLKAKVVTQANATVPAGTVVGENPPPGTALQLGSLVTLTVSGGNKLTVPNVVGMPEAQAQATIHAAGLGTTFANHAGRSTAVQVGEVESQDPLPGSLAAPGTVIYINVRSS